MEKNLFIKKNQKIWFKWGNGVIQRVFLYDVFKKDDETLYRGKMNKRYFVLKESDYGKTWALTKEELK